MKTARLLEGVNLFLAPVLRWLALAMVLLQFVIVIGRYVFGFNSIAAQEGVLYLHAALFMLAAGCALQADRHVRVDIFYSRWPAPWRRRVDICGHLFLLLPAVAALAWWSWPSVRNSWTILEGPISVGGIEAVFLLKSLIPAFCILLAIQSLASLLRLAADRERE